MIFPRTLVAFGQGLDGVTKRTMLAFDWVAFGVVRRRGGLANAQCGNNFRDEVTQELGPSVAVYLVTDSESREYFVDQFVHYYLRIRSSTWKGLNPTCEAVRHGQHVLVAFLRSRQGPYKIYTNLLERISRYMAD